MNRHEFADWLLANGFDSDGSWDYVRRLPNEMGALIISAKGGRNAVLRQEETPVALMVVWTPEDVKKVYFAIVGADIR